MSKLHVKSKAEHVVEVMESYIVISGNSVEGMNFHGPFSDPDDAQKWAKKHFSEECRVVKLAAPEGQPR